MKFYTYLITIVRLIALTALVVGCKGVDDDLRTKRNLDDNMYFGNRGLGNSIGLMKSVNPNSIPLLKDLDNEQYNIFTPDAKVIMAISQEGQRVELVFRTAAPFTKNICIK